MGSCLRTVARFTASLKVQILAAKRYGSRQNLSVLDCVKVHRNRQFIAEMFFSLIRNYEPFCQNSSGNILA